MNREIKFRAWDLERKKMIHFANQGICSEYNQLTFDVQEEEEKQYYGCLRDNKNILMQFTGLLDKNGKEIYEGDVVYLAEYGNYEVKFPFIELYESNKENYIGGIIGNIYESPELLK